MRNAILAVPLVLVCGAARADDAATHPAYWGSPSVDGGKCCATLTQVRDNIDRIDHAIVALMAERGKYVAEAAIGSRGNGRIEALSFRVCPNLGDDRVDSGRSAVTSPAPPAFASIPRARNPRRRRSSRGRRQVIRTFRLRTAFVFGACLASAMLGFPAAHAGPYDAEYVF
ncbi:MAG: hypothetical protein WBY97_09420, partial [Roseiarcus sp.]